MIVEFACVGHSKLNVAASAANVSSNLSIQAILEDQGWRIPENHCVQFPVRALTLICNGYVMDELCILIHTTEGSQQFRPPCDGRESIPHQAQSF